MQRSSCENIERIARLRNSIPRVIPNSRFCLGRRKTDRGIVSRQLASVSRFSFVFIRFRSFIAACPGKTQTTAVQRRRRPRCIAHSIFTAALPAILLDVATIFTIQRPKGTGLGISVPRSFHSANLLYRGRPRPRVVVVYRCAGRAWKKIQPIVYPKIHRLPYRARSVLIYR